MRGINGSRTVRLFCLALVWSFLSGCSEDKSRAVKGTVVYEFLTNGSSAEIAHHNRERISFGQEFTINNDKRAVLFEHPNAEIQFNTIAIPDKAVLQFGIGMSPESWSKPGDGVTFEITAVDEKSAKSLIFTSYIDPKGDSAHRKWFDQEVDLKEFAGQKISFIFRTTAGPRGNGDFDWAGWSSPQIRVRGN